MKKGARRQSGIETLGFDSAVPAPYIADVVCTMRKRSNTLNWQIPILSNNQRWCRVLVESWILLRFSSLFSPFSRWSCLYLLGSTDSDVRGRPSQRIGILFPFPFSSVYAIYHRVLYHRVHQPPMYVTNKPRSMVHLKFTSTTVLAIVCHKLTSPSFRPCHCFHRTTQSATLASPGQAPKC